MTYLLDSDTCIDVLRCRREVVERFGKAGAVEVAVSIVTVYELYAGCYLAVDLPKEIHRVETFLHPIAELGFERQDARRAAQVRATLKKVGASLNDCDVLLAGHALSRNLTFVTNNGRHFSRVPDLRFESWRTV